ncbi:MAG: response regulator [Planctomycetes bacterium]|nr:response regulator [Planctomycetota bacterium]
MNVPGAIPLPATLTKAIGDRLRTKESTCSTRLYSDYPFPWTKNGGPQDEFEKAALNALRADPDEPFYKFDVVDGVSMIRYATADRLQASCVACHNSHPESPKTDWREGDVRGVLAVSMPLQTAIVDTRAGVRDTLLVLGTIAAMVFLMFGMTFARLRRQTRQTTRSNEQLTSKMEELSAAELKLTQANRDLRSNASDLSRSRKAALNLIQDMQRANAASEAATQAKGEFLANMSHEIRTPMTAIHGYSCLLAEDEASALAAPNRLEMIQTICRNSEHLLTIINDILDISKIESGKMTVEHVDVSPVQIVEEVATLLKPRANSAGLDLCVQYDGLIANQIKSDPTRLRQILINLVANAIKFTKRGTVTIVVSLEDAPSGQRMLRIAVIDTGIGMTPEQRDKVARFEVFNQADTSTTRKFGGSGLGLRISNSFAQMLGGGLDIESECGKGSTFTVTIATGDIRAVKMLSQYDIVSRDAGTVDQVAKRAVPTSSNSLSGRRLLLAEDGPDNQRLISFVLMKAGAEVHVVENGELARDEALAARDAGDPFDVILMDMQMPVMDGYTATRALRNRNYRQPIIALTAHALSEDRQKCLDAGCDDYETKPIDRETLIEAVATCAERAEITNATTRE